MYLAVVAFTPLVSRPSALDRFAATSASIPIHTGTTTSLELELTMVFVCLFDLYFDT